jgi:hypothetical protein
MQQVNASDLARTAGAPGVATPPAAAAAAAEVAGEAEGVTAAQSHKRQHAVIGRCFCQSAVHHVTHGNGYIAVPAGVGVTDA